MILLDTNVLSTLISETRDAAVVQWLDRHPRVSIWTTSVNLFEVKHGLNIMPDGRRRRVLEETFQIFIADFLENRVSPFDVKAAMHAADFSSKRRSLGRPVEIRDTMIAGLAISLGAVLCTRNIRDFEHSGLELVNPWVA
jgi:predicted nucleic acid-binding protein